MKRTQIGIFFVLLLCIVSGLSDVYAAPITKTRGRLVNDFAAVIDAATETRLTALLEHVERKSSAEIAVVTVSSLDGQDIASYAVRLFEQWGIGKKGKDNGVLFLVAPRERKMRIEVGYGLEGALPDGLCGAISDQYIIPHFKSGDFNGGIWNGTAAIVGVVGKEYNMDLLSAQGLSEQRYAVKRPSLLATVIGKIIYILFIFLIFGGRFWFFPFFFGFPMRRGYWSGGTYRGGGGFSGGFGGFGGGLSGGGGISRSW